ncbi:DOPA 4,5-dioxygenase family protein [Burkholderia sp. Ac-20353]|uniref:DOPA 4,5-dioxygenase family protein n=1 Tax=Burkholderia sp. Ac-20353 TaxID=2703894 RepID=UPI00197C5762|nr:DOPA 4,5-dioxygenase family protein [Burkholderia sp. Ac-20353]MBN3788381.1 DOPA 4,5-dioxygenase family protein [Burkholderia sp. Ac-20353]
MTYLSTTAIENWHAHVYFDETSRDDAWAFRQVVTAHFGDAVQLGRFNERLVGPHPRWSYEIAFSSGNFGVIAGWLILNHRALDILLHPNTDDELRDHRDSAVWIGRAYTLNLSALENGSSPAPA